MPNTRKRHRDRSHSQSEERDNLILVLKRIEHRLGRLEQRQQLDIAHACVYLYKQRQSSALGVDATILLVASEVSQREVLLHDFINLDGTKKYCENFARTTDSDYSPNSAPQKQSTLTPENVVDGSGCSINLGNTTPSKHIMNKYYFTPIQSPKPSTSFAVAPDFPVIYSSNSDTDGEGNVEQQLPQLLKRKQSVAANIYTSEDESDTEGFDSDDNMPLARIAKKYESPFHELLPTLNYAVTKNKSKRKAINYKGQRITKDLFKEQKSTLETKKPNNPLKNRPERNKREI
nr:unnamed protein product [Callosobruchus analis]